MKKLQMLIVLSGLTVFSVATSRADTILDDTFNYSASDLNGVSPGSHTGDVGSNSYSEYDTVGTSGGTTSIAPDGTVAGTAIVTTDGGVTESNTDTEGAAVLVYPTDSLASNELYTLTLNFNFAAAAQTDQWVGVGFNGFDDFEFLRPGSYGLNNVPAGSYVYATFANNGNNMGDNTNSYVALSSLSDINETITFNTATNVISFYIDGNLLDTETNTESLSSISGVFVIAQNTGSNASLNELSLMDQSVPEPRAGLLVACGLSLLVFFARRRIMAQLV